MTIQLRPYQQEAVDACLTFWRNGGRNGLLVLPTGAGKSLTMASLVQRVRREFGGARPLIMAHRSGLIEQNHGALLKLWPDAPVGIVAAQLRKNQVKTPITFGTVLTVKNKLPKLGLRQILIIDEAQFISHRDDTTYRRIVKHFEKTTDDMCVLGVTATPFRLSTGRLDENYGDHPALFEGVIYEKPVRELIDEGYLSPLVTRAPKTQVSGDGVRKSGGEYVASELGRAVNIADVNDAAVAEIIEAGRDRKGWLVFCVGIGHAEAVAEKIKAAGVSCAVLTSKTDYSEREAITKAYQKGELRCLVNVSILTEGFDAPHTDLLAILRPTLSLGLHIQILGRGMRLAEGKSNCLVLDFARNTERLGPIDVADGGKEKGAGSPPPGKTCPSCEAIIATGYLKCPECGYDFPAPVLNIAATASNAAIFSDQENAEWLDVTSVSIAPHTSSKSGKTMLRVDYQCGLTKSVSKYVCLEHEPDNWAFKLAQRWWGKHAAGSEPPATVAEAMIRQHELRHPGRIMAQRRGKYYEIVDEDFSVSVHA